MDSIPLSTHIDIDINSECRSSSSRDIALNQNQKPKQQRKQSRKRKRRRSEWDESIQHDMQQMQINDDNINHKELYLKEKEKIKKLSSELEVCRKERDHWQLKYEELYHKVQNVLDTDRQSAPPPLRK